MPATETSSTNSESPTFIDLFAGCGGLSLGLFNAGWQGLFAIEHNESAFQTLKHNLVDGDTFGKFQWPEWLDKSEISIQDFLKNHEDNLKALEGKVDLIAGGPPCQGFSFAGSRSDTDERNHLYKHYLKVVKHVRPKFVLMENVQGIAVVLGAKYAPKKRKPGRPKEAYATRIIRGLRNAGYVVKADSLHSYHFGVPQQRTRFFIFGYRDDLEIEGNPLQIMEEYAALFRQDKGLTTSQSVLDAIGDLEASHGKEQSPDSKRFKAGVLGKQTSVYQKLLRGATKEGNVVDSHRFANHTDKIKTRWTKMQKELRAGVRLKPSELSQYGTKKISIVILDKEKPSHTLTTLPDDLIHYSEPRILTAREYARIQSFPDDFQFRGKYTTGGPRRVKEVPRYSQIGNAVPPLVAEAWGTKIMEWAQSKAEQSAATADLAMQPEKVPAE